MLALFMTHPQVRLTHVFKAWSVKLAEWPSGPLSYSWQFGHDAGIICSVVLAGCHTKSLLCLQRIHVCSMYSQHHEACEANCTCVTLSKPCLDRPECFFALTLQQTTFGHLPTLSKTLTDLYQLLFWSFLTMLSRDGANPNSTSMILSSFPLHRCLIKTRCTSPRCLST